MSRIYNVGGLDGFGPVPRDDDQPLYGADWEAHVLAVSRALVRRHVITASDMAAAISRRSSGNPGDADYGVWLDALCELLVASGALTGTEVAALSRG